MNKIVIIAALCGLGVGGAGGYLACHFIEKKNVDREISEGVQQALKEIRDSQREKAMENENKKSEMIKTTGRNINPVPHFDAKDLVGDIVLKNGYKTESSEVKEPEEAPESDDDGLPFEVGEVESHNIWDDEEDDGEHLTQEEYDLEQEPEGIDIKKLDPTKPPYVITEDQYNNELDDETCDGLWDKVSLIFFKDNVFAEKVRMDEFTSMSATEIEMAIGKANMREFVDNRSLQRMFVRNNRLHIDYEIVRSSRSYSSAMHEEDEEE